MERFVVESDVPASQERLFEWHGKQEAFLRLLPPWRRIELLTPPPPLTPGGEVATRLRFGMRAIESLYRITDASPPDFFVDEQIVGPFASWRHHHRFEPLGGDRSRLIDEVEYVLPAAARFARRRVEREVERLFGYRHRVVKADLHAIASHSIESMRIAITGSSGLVGTQLSCFLGAAGHTVLLVQRGASPPEGCDALIHLAGENVAGRWSREKKRRILESRVEGTRSLVEALERLEAPPKTLLVASGAGYYGDSGSDSVTEAAPKGEGFLADVVEQWEEQAMRYTKGRVACMRIGMVLALQGGALARMVPPFRLGLGGVIGSGKQGVSWIAIDDLLYQIYFLLATPSCEGAYNVCAPHPVTNQQLTHSLAQRLHRPAAVPMPATATRLLFGEMGEELLLKGAFVAPQRLIEAGAQFAYPALESALDHLFR